MEKKVAVVTGASRGIGAAIARELAAAGMYVVINYCGSEEKAQELKTEIEQNGGEASIYKCDVSDNVACKEFIGNVIAEYGHLDVLVNNAGITRDGLLMRMSEEDFDKQIKELMPDYIKSDLVWEAVAAKEGIKASGEDYDKFVDKMMSTLKFDKKDDLFDVYPETMVKRMYIEQEAKDKLIKQAKVKYVETTSEDTTEQTQSDGSEDTGNTDNTSENAEVKDTIDTTTGK